jgi:hypothetical protein
MCCICRYYCMLCLISEAKLLLSVCMGCKKSFRKRRISFNLLYFCILRGGKWSFLIFGKDGPLHREGDTILKI